MNKKIKISIALGILFITLLVFADSKITDLTLLPGASVSTADVMPIVDVSEGITKKISVGDIDTRYIGANYLQYASATQDGFLTSTDWATFYSKSPGFTTASPLHLVGTSLTIDQATSGQSGYLSYTDWNTFNNKQDGFVATAPIDVTSGTISIPVATNLSDGYLSSTDWTTFDAKQEILSFTYPLNNSANTITISQASDTLDGYLSSTNWSTFNSKQNAITANTPLDLTSDTLTLAQATVSTDGYLSSIDWNIFNNKQETLTANSPLDLTSNTLTIAQSSSTTTGSLSSIDWSTFNNKANAALDNLAGTTSINTHLYPSAHDTYSLGKTDLRWNELYALGSILNYITLYDYDSGEQRGAINTYSDSVSFEGKGYGTDSADLLFKTVNASSNSGNITLQTGTGTTRGYINLDSSLINLLNGGIKVDTTYAPYFWGSPMPSIMIDPAILPAASNVLHIGSKDVSTNAKTNELVFLTGSNLATASTQDTGKIYIYTGYVSDSNGASSGGMEIVTGDVYGNNGASGGLSIKSGTGAGASGAVRIETGAAGTHGGSITLYTGSGASSRGSINLDALGANINLIGNVDYTNAYVTTDLIFNEGENSSIIQSINSASTNTGSIYLLSGDSTNNNSGTAGLSSGIAGGEHSGNVVISSGDATTHASGISGNLELFTGAANSVSGNILMYSGSGSSGNGYISLTGSEVKITGPLTLQGSSSSYAGLQSPSTGPGVTWTMPSADSTGTQALISNGSGTLSWSDFLTSIDAQAPLSYVSNTLSIPVASSTTSGYLTSSNWSTFNNKLDSFTANAPLDFTNNTLTIPVASSTTSGYLSSTDWASFNAASSSLIKARAVRSGNQTVCTNNSNVKITMTAESFDLNSNYDLANSKYVVPSNGYYQVNAGTRMLATNVAAGYYYVKLYKGGSEITPIGTYSGQVATKQLRSIISDFQYFAANDEIEVYYFGSVDNGTNCITIDEAYFSIYKIN